MTDYIVDTRAAIENGVSKKIIIKTTEEFLDNKYHISYENWEPERYPYLTEGNSGNITGTRPSGARDYIGEGRVLVNWYNMEQEYGKQDELKKIFSPEQEFNEELL